MQWDSRNISYAVLIVVTAGNVAKPQSPPKPTPKDIVIESNRKELDNLLLRKPILATDDNAARQATLKQINEDFKALQILNNSVQTETSNQNSIDYNAISKLMSEIGGRASRLKANLMLPKPQIEKKKEVQTSSLVDFKGELTTLDKVVLRFTTNPIFQQSGVIDIELAKKASCDLASIIEQSGRLKKAAAKLAKN